MKTKIIPTDFRGSSLDIGTIVAYNLSGEIALGRVKSFKTTPVRYLVTQNIYSFKIEVIQARGFSAGHISTIRTQYNLMALL